MECHLLGRYLGTADKIVMMPPLLMVLKNFKPRPGYRSYVGNVVLDCENGTMSKLEDGVLHGAFDFLPDIAALLVEPNQCERQ